MENRKAHRVVFERGHAANMMAIDGTWRRPCTMEDVSDTGARLTIDGSIEGLNLKEFFLLLSTMGKAYRRCQLAWVNGDQVGVHFLKPGNKRNPSAVFAKNGADMRRRLDDDYKTSPKNRYNRDELLEAWGRKHSRSKFGTTRQEPFTPR